MKKIFMLLIIITILFLNLSISFAYPQSFTGTNYYPSNMNEPGYDDLIIMAMHNTGDRYFFIESWIDTDATFVQVGLSENSIYKKAFNFFDNEYRIDLKYTNTSDNWIQGLKGSSYGGEFVLKHGVFSNTNEFEVLYSTIELRNKKGDIIYIPGSPGDDYELDFWANVHIVQPRDGFNDNIHAFSVSIVTDFTKILSNDEIENIKIDVLLNGVKAESFDVIYNKMSNTTFYSTNELQLLIDVPVGLNNVEVIYSFSDIELGRDSVNFTRLEGFIDEDGDGLDDRTGNPYVPENPVYPGPGIDKPVKPGEDGTAIDWLNYLADYVGYIFEILINSISNFAKNVVSGVGSVLSLAEPMFNFVSQFFSSMPVEVRTAIMAMFSVSVFLVIMKMIRG